MLSSIFSMPLTSFKKRCVFLSLHRFRLKLEALTDKDPGLLELDSEEEEDGGLVSSPVDQTSGTLSGETGDQGDPSLEPLLPGSQGPGAGGPGGDLPASQPQPTATSALLEEEDVVIEEYDSDF